MKQIRMTPKAKRPPRLYCVYVVELDAAAMFADAKCSSPDEKIVYVGETSQTPEERLEQHLRGKYYSKLVRRYNTGLLPELGAGPFATEQEALDAEQRVATDLRSRGYTVPGTHGKRPVIHRKAAAMATRTGRRVGTARATAPKSAAARG